MSYATMHVICIIVLVIASFSFCKLGMISKGVEFTTLTWLTTFDTWQDLPRQRYSDTEDVKLFTLTWILFPQPICYTKAFPETRKYLTFLSVAMSYVLWRGKQQSAKVRAPCFWTQILSSNLSSGSSKQASSHSIDVWIMIDHWCYSQSHTYLRLTPRLLSSPRTCRRQSKGHQPIIDIWISQ